MKTFSGADLGDCSSTSFSSESTFNVTFHHPSTDAWNGDWIKIFFDNQQKIECKIDELLDPQKGKNNITTSCSELEAYKKPIIVQMMTQDTKYAACGKDCGIYLDIISSQVC